MNVIKYITFNATNCGHLMNQKSQSQQDT